VPAAATIEQMYEAGQPELLMERDPEEMTPASEGPTAGAEDSADGGSTSESSGGDVEEKGCQQRSATPSLLALMLLMLSLLHRVTRVAREVR